MVFIQYSFLLSQGMILVVFFSFRDVLVQFSCPSGNGFSAILFFFRQGMVSMQFSILQGMVSMQFSILQGMVSAQFSSYSCLLYTSPSPRDQLSSRMPSSA